MQLHKNKNKKHNSVGHQMTVDKILAWLEADGVKGETICDAGCGVGSLAIPMAMLGAKVRVAAD
jgi:magnesium-protoporphyrin O-methyltransferase